MKKNATILLAILILLALVTPAGFSQAIAQDQGGTPEPETPPDPGGDRRWDGDGDPFQVMLRDDRYPEEGLLESQAAGPLFPTLDTEQPPLEGYAGPFSAVAVVSGYSHSCALTSAGGVKCWGDNSLGKLGDGTTTNRLTPVNVVGLSSGVVAISASHKHTCALLSSGRVKCWGYNLHGELGDGTSVYRAIPVEPVGLGSEVVQVTAGGFHTCARMANGRVKCWGANWHGQVGDGSTSHQYTPVDVDTTDWFVSVSAGKFHTCGVNQESRVKCWGYNKSGQLGDTTTTQRVRPVYVAKAGFGYTAVSLGGLHSCALKSGGAVKCWGENKDSQLGDGSRQDAYTPVDVSGLTSGVTAISGGGYFTCALVGSTNLKCWGSNWAGQVGIGATSNRVPTPTDVIGFSGTILGISTGDSHACAATSAGALKCWGSNAFGQIGDGTAAMRLAPTGVLNLSNGMVGVAAGGMHSCGLTASGRVKCWGFNRHGELGDGSNENRLAPVDVVGLPGPAVAITVGDFHSCALLATGGVKCWGYNNYGQLGDRTNTTRWAPVDVYGLTGNVIAIDAGSNHTCAILTQGTLLCWGDNYAGQLGIGTKDEMDAPTRVKNLAGIAIVAVRAGTSHTCALTSAGGVKCWGGNSSGELGDGTTDIRLSPVDVAGLNNGAVEIAVGADHSCALLSNNTVKCWGSSTFGQVGNGSDIPSRTPVDVAGLSGAIKTIDAGGYHTCALMATGELRCWGDNWAGQLGDGTTIVRPIPVSVNGLPGAVAHISGGAYHSCAITEAGAALCWGTNGNGQLGDGTLPWRTTPTDVVNLEPLTLAINFPDGQPGSFFTVTGSNYPPGGEFTVSANGLALSPTVMAGSDGRLSFLLNTAGAQVGRYMISLDSIPRKAAGFHLITSAPLRSPQGSGPVLNIPGEIALTSFLFMPFSARQQPAVAASGNRNP